MTSLFRLYALLLALSAVYAYFDGQMIGEFFSDPGCDPATLLSVRPTFLSRQLAP